MRILSLLPSATEIVCALGARSELVGRSDECDFPDSVRSLPVVMRARTGDSDRPSSEIDVRVRAARAAGEGLYELDLPSLRRLSPEVILTQDLCGVCSVTEQDVRAACAVTGLAPEIVSLTPRDLEGVWRSITTIGAAIRRAREAEHLIATLRTRASPSGAPEHSRSRVAVIEWLDPPILAGLWTPDIVTAAGGSYHGPGTGSPGIRTSWEQLATEELDLAVISPCSFSVERSVKELDGAALRSAVRRLRPTRGTVLADEAYFSRPGPRLAAGVELIRGLLRGEGPSGPMPAIEWSAPELEVLP
ncbi:MAG: cobalamin-binding protein [Thermoplasmata archaeon]|nr:cobalamin-binding protein [Thermoplasmata archaeon]